MDSKVKRILRISVLSVFFLLIALYAFSRSYYLISGIKIQNVNITDGQKVTDSIILVEGNAKNAINLTLNGREISINQAGDFKETMALLLGYNIINITAKDKFGYIDKKNYKIIYNQ